MEAAAQRMADAAAQGARRGAKRVVVRRFAAFGAIRLFHLVFGL
jgi:hypothetical protein